MNTDHDEEHNGDRCIVTMLALFGVALVVVGFLIPGCNN